jgi:hypothetical protein
MATDTTPRTGSTTLARLLDEELAFSPSFQRYYSNHLAMALVALDLMGARPEVLQATFDAHARGESEPRDDVAVLQERRREVASDGIAATVRARVPALAAGPHSQLFHPMIRLAYALDVGHEGQVAAALLDWERRHQVLPAPPASPGDRRLHEVAADLAAHPPGTWPRTFDLDGTARRPEMSAALAGVALDDATLDDVSTFAIVAHTVADDFVTLHMVTGTRALRAVSAWVDDDTAQRLVAHTVPAMAVAYAAVGAPALLGAAELDAVRRTALPSRGAIAERAIRDHDPHVVKLANVALLEEERTGDPLYRHSAARVVGLL